MLRFFLIAFACIAVLVIAVLMISYWRFLAEINRDVKRLESQAAASASVITEAMLATVPAPAQRYFRYAGVLGRSIPRLIRLKQKGRIRNSEAAGWMTFEADETYSTNPPAFVWRATFPSPMMPLVLGRDEYLDGKGSILMKAAALLPVANEGGEELRTAGLMRYLNETMWFPVALLGPNISITPVDDASFKVVLSDRGLAAEALLFVDADGRLTNFRARRYNTSTRSIETWETPIAAYGMLDGMRVPVSGSAVWRLTGGDLTYIELEIIELTHEN
jgi:hypothetical protein